MKLINRDELLARIRGSVRILTAQIALKDRVRELERSVATDKPVNFQMPI
jgi:hypothetical protein